MTGRMFENLRSCLLGRVPANIPYPHCGCALGCSFTSCYRHRSLNPIASGTVIWSNAYSMTIPCAVSCMFVRDALMCRREWMRRLSGGWNLTEFNWIATPSPICVGNPGWHRTRKPLAYRVSCHTHSPHLNIHRSFKIVIYLILEHIYTSSINGSLFHSFIVRWENAYFLISNLHRSLANAQLCPRVPLSVLY